ncbi:MAG: hypothetical protein PQJ58_05600, partial [Spirochaetales bacterium]|nr:hypothetical protein [Spirochaetales bacterium]
MNAEKRIIQMDDASPKISKDKKRKRLVLILAFAALGAGVAGYLWYAARPETVTLRDYESSVVRSGEFVSTTEASGTVLLPTQVEIVSPREGYADTLLVSEGDQIGTDDVLAQL